MRDDGQAGRLPAHPRDYGAGDNQRRVRRVSGTRNAEGRPRYDPTKGADRIKFWGREYLSACRQTLQEAKRFAAREDWFTAYLCLFVAFNNAYCLVARFDGLERDKIATALQKVPDRQIDELYNQQYVSLVHDLNDGLPEQFSDGPDHGVQLQGIVKMKEYFLGYEPQDCVAHIETVSAAESSTDEKRQTLAALSAGLLLAIRNNEFHAVKGPRKEADRRTLKMAYKLLLPLAENVYATAESGTKQSDSVGQKSN